MRDTNRLAELECFLAVVEEGSFSGAAARRRMSPSAVSKMMARLEARLNATLIRRTTRRLQITDEGQRFAEAARRVLAQLDDLELLIGDGVTDLSGQPVDLAVRAGPLPDSSLRARSLGRSELIEVRAPGAPEQRLGFAYARRDPIWNHDTPRIRASDGNTIAILAAHGCGISRSGRFVVAEALRDGRLVEVPGSKAAWEEFHVIYLGTARTLPARIAAVVDHLVLHGRVDRTAKAPA